jgi:flagellar biosynthesis protein FlhF
MQIRTFRAATINEALDQVKRELGHDAILLGNRKITLPGNVSGIEVTAAVEHEARPEAAPPEMLSDIREIKSLLSLLISSKDTFARIQLEEPLAEIYHSLLMRGLDERQAFVFLRKTLLEMGEPSVEKNLIVEAFSRQVVEKIKFSRPFSSGGSQKPTGRIFAFVGPTGVGKTTTLAKLAALIKLKRGKSVGIISVDTYRIGAVDQLRTYANILGVPFIVAQSRTQFNKAKASLANRDFILVDTIGKNYLQKEHVVDLERIFADTQGVNHLLVLSAAAKDLDLKHTIQHFQPVSIQSLVFTKVDETLSHGCMINQLLRFPYAVSYFGTGQRVPEDIETATQKRLLMFLFPPGNGSSGKD